jgi:hypothetical protein
MLLKLFGGRPDGIRRAHPIGEGGAQVGIIELIIIILVILWLVGYFGRGRISAPGLSGNWIHTLLVIVVILVILRLLHVV